MFKKFIVSWTETGTLAYQYPFQSN
jgi:hypothetical protein